jgi:hypothetical protein
MNGPIAQIVALTIYGNAVLTGHSIPKFFPDNSTCKFCDEIAFAELGKSLFGKIRESRIAASPDEWFSYLRKKGARGVRLLRKAQNDARISDRMSAGFVGGGGTWMIEVILAKGRSEYWVARWEVWNKNAPEQRIWRVTYGRADQGSTTNSPAPDLLHLKQRFLTRLQAIRSFSVKEKCDPFTASFDKALDTISAHGLELHGYHRDLSPAGFLQADAVVMLDAAQSSYVFGGMGTWNDMGFAKETQKEYEQVSEDLFRALNEVIVAATNTSYYRGRTTG